MPTDKERADALAAELATMKADLAAATAATAAATASATAAIEAAVVADRDRRAAIMALDEAQGREALADHLFATGSTVEQAKATLSVSPKAQPETGDAYEAQRLAGAVASGSEPADANHGWGKVTARHNKLKK